MIHGFLLILIPYGEQGEDDTRFSIFSEGGKLEYFTILSLFKYENSIDG
jgi:hypothetical protein